MTDNGKATSLTPPSPILVNPAIGGVLLCQYLSWTDSIKPSLIHLLFVLLPIVLESCKHASMNYRTIAINLVGQPNVVIIFQIPSRLTVSFLKALTLSTKVMLRSIFCFWYFCWKFLTERIISIGLLTLTGRISTWSRCSCRRVSRRIWLVSSRQ